MGTNRLVVDLETENINFLNDSLADHANDMVELFSEIYSPKDIGASRVDFNTMKFQLFHKRGLIEFPLIDVVERYKILSDRLDMYIGDLIGLVFNGGLKRTWLQKIEWDNARQIFTLEYVLE